MDPLAVVKLIWKHRLLAIPVLILTMLSCSYVTFFGPRTYQSTASYVLIDPKVPTEDELARNSRLSRLNSDNPYLRSSDPSLAAQVLVSKLSAESTEKEIQSAGLSTDYTVERVANNSLMVLITGYGATKDQSLATRDWLSKALLVELRAMQKIYGADDLYLFIALPVDIQVEATEKISSRLRLLIVTLFGGAVILFGAVCIGETVDRNRLRRPRPEVADRPRTSPKSSRKTPDGAPDWGWGSADPQIDTERQPESAWTH